MSAAAFETIETDVLVVGGGLAALRAALSARAAGARVLVAVKRKAGRSGCSANTSGGYAAAWDFLDELDNARLHYEDTVIGSGWVSERALVSAMAEEAPRRLQELFDIGAKFRMREGRYHLSPSGDHRRPRVLVPENMRGTDMTLPLREAVVEAGCELLENCVVVDLVRDGDRVVGAIGIGRETPRVWNIRAGATILAAGGAGRMFPVTSNPIDVRGGGYALALRAGARLRDMEFIQFYPWRLIRPFKGTRMPIQPSTFVAGGKLFNSRGERFMEAYDPVKKEAAMRDVSARGIFDQIRKGLDVEGGVTLDVSDIPDEQFRIDNTKVVDALDPKGIDYREIPLVVAPEAHFFMGGVLTDVDGRTDLSGLYAAGENASGVHGGNRLNSNAVPETQVFGHRAGIDAAAFAGRRRQGAEDGAAAAQTWAGRLAGIQDPAAQPGAGMSALVQELQQAINLGIGIVRTADGLQRCMDALADIRERAAGVPLQTLGDLVTSAEIDDMCRVGTACASSALYRTESRAAHYRDDYPATSTDWVCSVAYSDAGLERLPIAQESWEFEEVRPVDAADPSAKIPGAQEFIE